MQRYFSACLLRLLAGSTRRIVYILAPWCVSSHRIESGLVPHQTPSWLAPLLGWRSPPHDDVIETRPLTSTANFSEGLPLESLTLLEDACEITRLS